MFGTFDTSTSGLTAQRVRLETIASNIANIDSVKDADGNVNPYRRVYPIFEAQRTARGGAGVRVSKVAEDQSGFVEKYEPWNRELADANGIVRYPNVNLSTEYVNAMETTRAYEANVTAIETTKSMMAATLRILA